MEFSPVRSRDGINWPANVVAFWPSTSQRSSASSVTGTAAATIRRSPLKHRSILDRSQTRRFASALVFLHHARRDVEFLFLVERCASRSHRAKNTRRGQYNCRRRHLRRRRVQSVEILLSPSKAFHRCEDDANSVATPAPRRGKRRGRVVELLLRGF